jgi:hypothetical protein
MAMIYLEGEGNPGKMDVVVLEVAEIRKIKQPKPNG